MSHDRDMHTADFWRMCDDIREEDCWVRLSDLTPQVVKLATYAVELKSVCESPIEIALGAELRLLIDDYFPPASATLVPQFKLDRFRYDFAVQFTKDERPALLIECDGREFHTKPEDVANDRRKDAAATKAGIRLMRFTGSDINRNGRGCVLIIVGELLAYLRSNAA